MFENKVTWNAMKRNELLSFICSILFCILSIYFEINTYEAAKIQFDSVYSTTWEGDDLAWARGLKFQRKKFTSIFHMIQPDSI